MTPTQIQEAKEKQQESPIKSPHDSGIKLPPLEITEAEEDQFVESLATGVPFSKTISYGDGKKFSLTFVDRTVKQTEFMTRFLDKKMRESEIDNWPQYLQYFNLASLYFQVTHVNGVKQSIVPIDSIFSKIDLFKEIEGSVISEWTNSQQFIAIGMMSQFNQAMLKLSSKAFGDPDFS